MKNSLSVIACEGTTVRGVCCVQDFTSYYFDSDGYYSGVAPSNYGRNKFEYSNILYPVKWFNWTHLNIDPPSIRAQGVSGINKCGICNLEEIFSAWEMRINSNDYVKDIWEMANVASQKKAAKIIQKTCDVLKDFGQIVLTGPPGTGKTYTAKQLAISLVTGQPFTDDPKEEFNHLSQTGQAEIIQFHPSYNYEDFVRGIQVSTNDDGQPVYETKNRIFSSMVKKAAERKDDDQKFVLIIDEINRANLAAVLGELIYALEYRGEYVHTPYEVDGDFKLSVPSNLYIVGTMNTADRSIGNIDYAVRRRFAFVPCLPTGGTLADYPSGKKLFLLVEGLFKDKGSRLSPDFHPDDVQPGHTYFMSKGEDLARKFAYQVYPLLREYFKDGILVNGGELALQKGQGAAVEINRQMPANEVLEIVRDWIA